MKKIVIFIICIFLLSSCSIVKKTTFDDIKANLTINCELPKGFIITWDEDDNANTNTVILKNDEEIGMIYTFENTGNDDEENKKENDEKSDEEIEDICKSLINNDYSVWVDGTYSMINKTAMFGEIAYYNEPVTGSNKPSDNSLKEIIYVIIVYNKSIDKAVRIEFYKDLVNEEEIIAFGKSIKLTLYK